MAEGVSFGVPWPQGAVKKGQTFSLKDAEGKALGLAWIKANPGRFAELIPLGTKLVAFHLLDANALPEALADPKVRFVSNGGEVRAAWGGPRVSLAWSGPAALTVTRDPTAEVYKSEAQVAGAAITVVNLLYLLTQIAITVDDCEGCELQLTSALGTYAEADAGQVDIWNSRTKAVQDGSVTFTDRSQGICTLGVWGPNAAATMAKITTDNTTAAYDLSQDGFPYGAVQDVLIDGVPCTMFRISYVGENGWEIYTRMEHGLQLWDAIWDAGQEFEIIPVGIGVYAVTGRIEKGYRLMGAELESEYNPVEAGLARPKVKAADFIGKAAYLKAREEGPAAIMCTLSMDSQRCADGYDRFPTGGNEPILTLAGDRIVDAKGRVSRVTTAGAGPSVGKYLLLAYLPPEHAVVGTSDACIATDERRLANGPTGPDRHHDRALYRAGGRAGYLSEVCHPTELGSRHLGQRRGISPR